VKGDEASAGSSLDGEVEGLRRELQRFLQDLEKRLEAKVVELRDLLAQAESTQARLQASLAEARLAGIQPASEAVPAGPVSSQRDQVMELFRRGLRPEAIAGALGMPRGEVELILGLERRA
jgi:hypothetical protein